LVDIKIIISIVINYPSKKIFGGKKIMKFNLKNVFLSVGIFVFTLTLVGFISTNKAQAATRTASVSGIFGDTATWGGASVPTTNDDIVINSGITVTASAGLTHTAALTNNGILSISGGNFTVTAPGAVTNNGTVTLTGNLAGDGAFTNAATSTLNIGGSSTITTLTATASNTVNYTGDAPTCKTTTYYNLNFTGSGTVTCASTAVTNVSTSGTVSWTLGAALTAGGTLTVGSGTSITTAGFAMTVTGITNVSGTLTLTNNTGAKTFTGLVTVNSGGTLAGASTNIITSAGIANAGTVSITGTDTIGTAGATFSGAGTTSIANLTISTGTTTNTGTLVISGTLTVNAAMTNSGTLTATTALSGSNTLTNTGILYIAGTSGITGLTANGAGTVEYSGVGQTLHAGPYYKLILSGSGTKTIPASTSIVNDLIISGTAKASFTGDLGQANALRFGATNLSRSGTWGSTTSTANRQEDTYFTGTGKVTIVTGKSGATQPLPIVVSSDSTTNTTTVSSEETTTSATPVVTETPVVVETPATPNPTTVVKFMKALSKSSMTDVKNLQKALNEVGNANLTVDGKWGPKTTTAVKAFQKAHGFSQVGTVGPQTRAKLNSLLGL